MDRYPGDTMTNDLYTVRRYVSSVTLTLLVILTVASIVNLRDMANLTHAASGLTSWIVAVGIGATLTTLSYVASVTDGKTRTTVTGFAIVAAFTSATLQVSLFVTRGATLWVSIAFGAGVPFFEVALALTDSMLRRYVNHTQNAVEPAKKAQPVKVPQTPVTPHSAPPAPPVTVAVPAPPKVAPVTVAMENWQALTVTELAERLDVSRQTVSTWKAKGVLDAKVAERLPVSNNGKHVNGGVNHDQ